MSTLAGQLDDYLRLRRGLGFQLGQHGSVLPGFVAYAAASGAGTVTVELAVTWARLPVGIKPITADFRLSEVRGFARYLHAIDPAHEIPPPGLLAVPRRRPRPTSTHRARSPRCCADPAAPAAAAGGHLSDAARAAGRNRMRLGEAMALTRADVDLDEGVVTVRHAKFDRIRLVPLHPSVTTGSATTPPRGTGSAPRRASIGSSCPSPGGLCGEGGRRSSARSPSRSGLRTNTVHPRVHDLRHAFAVHTLIDGHRHGADISALLPVLSTYLGHVEPRTPTGTCPPSPS